MKIKITGPDGKTYQIEVPEGADPESTVEQFGRDMGWSKPASNADEGLRAVGNTARIAGTAALQGVANMGDTVAKVLGPPPKVMGQSISELTGFTPLALRPGGVKGSMERGGLPTDPKAEAARLGAEYTPLRQSLGAAARVGTEVALMGGGVLPSILSGAGAAAGRGLTGSDWGETIGAIAAPLAAGRIGQSFARKAPTMAELDAQKKALYKASEDAGAIIKDTSYGRAVNKIGDELEKFPAFGNPKIAPATTEALKIVEKPIGQHMTLEGAEMMSRTVGKILKTAAAKGEATDVMLLSKIKSGLDDLVRNAKPGDLLQGDPRAVDLLNQARSVAQRYMKAREIERVIKLAETRAASPDLALRNEFATFARRMDRSSPLDLAGSSARTAKPGATRWPGYSRAEQGAVEEFLKPSGVRRLIRMMGYAPQFVPLIGEGGKKIAEKAALRDAQKLVELMRRGGPPPTTALSKAARMGALLGGAATLAD